MKLVTLLSVLGLGTLTSFSQVYQRPRYIKVKTPPLVAKTIINAPTNSRTFHASAYSLRGRTASGEQVRHGIIAADPRVLKLGTRVRIHGMGDYTVKDTGGAIKGTRIDIWVPDRRTAMKFGRRKVQLTVLE